MKLVKKWLFPALTCLIVAGAAALPPHLSRLRDAGQFDQVHTEALEATSLPTREAPTLVERMALYEGQYDSNHPILSFRDAAYFEDLEAQALAQTVQELLTGAGVLPNWLFREEPFDRVTAGRVLLWDPAAEEAVQEPTDFWTIEWSYYSDKSHTKSVNVTLDAETGLPIHLYVGDTNMSQWLPYKTEDLRALAERFLGLLGVEVKEVEPFGPQYDYSLDLSYTVTGTPLAFHVSRAPTAMSISLDVYGKYRDTVTDSSSAYDG